MLYMPSGISCLGKKEKKIIQDHREDGSIRSNGEQLLERKRIT